jgi:large subunit ribosomal protein L6
MSRVGKLPVPIPKGVKIALSGKELTVEGPKGKLVKTFHPEINIDVGDDAVTVTRSSDKTFHRALHGLTRALINNMVTGVTEGFKKELELVGVGYRGEKKGKGLMLYVGYSHPVLVRPPDTVDIDFDHKAGLITVTGIDKELVGLTADRIRSIRKPEPYKGKGIKYKGEHIRRKAGKTAA